MEGSEPAGATANPFLRLMALTVIAYMWSRMAAGAKENLTPVLLTTFRTHQNGKNTGWRPPP